MHPNVEAFFVDVRALLQQHRLELTICTDDVVSFLELRNPEGTISFYVEERKGRYQLIRLRCPYHSDARCSPVQEPIMYSRLSEECSIVFLAELNQLVCKYGYLFDFIHECEYKGLVFGSPRLGIYATEPPHYVRADRVSQVRKLGENYIPLSLHDITKNMVIMYELEF